MDIGQKVSSTRDLRKYRTIKSAIPRTSYLSISHRRTRCSDHYHYSFHHLWAHFLFFSVPSKSTVRWLFFQATSSLLILTFSDFSHNIGKKNPTCWGQIIKPTSRSAPRGHSSLFRGGKYIFSGEKIVFALYYSCWVNRQPSFWNGEAGALSLMRLWHHCEKSLELNNPFYFFNIKMHSEFSATKCYLECLSHGYFSFSYR